MRAGTGAATYSEYTTPTDTRSVEPMGSGSPCIGVDLAAQPRRTSIARVHWGDRPTVVDLASAADDDLIVDWCDGAAAIGIDAPFGWPSAFVDLVSRHHHGLPANPGDGSESLRLRVTDRIVWETTGKQPLSVSTDKIGIVAFRCVRLLDRLRGPGLDRSGADGVYEVYPGVALARWGLPSRGYKRGDQAPAVRAEIVQTLEHHVDFGAWATQVRSSDDDLDAVISALLAGLAARGETIRPDPDTAAAASSEGWIHVPSGPLGG